MSLHLGIKEQTYSWWFEQKLVNISEVVLIYIKSIIFLYVIMCSCLTSRIIGCFNTFVDKYLCFF